MGLPYPLVVKSSMFPGSWLWHFRFIPDVRKLIRSALLMSVSRSTFYQSVFLGKSCAEGGYLATKSAEDVLICFRPIFILT